jgi:hypothetical protein
MWPDDENRIAMALPRVCRQIYAESAAMAYSQNTFSFFYYEILDT